MIEWMQTHRKWLVITIWIATISFIGAGFVGWGQFQFNRKSSTILKIEDTEVSIKDLQNAYSELYSQLNEQLQGKLTPELAKQLGLEQQALQLVLKRGILREYAKELGLYVNDDEVAKKILEIFKTKENYLNYLKQTNQKAKEFESSLKNDILIQKLLTLINIKPTNTELYSVGSSLYNEDNLSIKIINKDNLKVKITDDELKKYWKKNKEKYKSLTKYKIAYEKVYLNKEVSEDVLKEFYNSHKNSYKNSKGEVLDFEKVKNRVKIDYLASKLRRDAFLMYKKLKDGEIKGKEVIVSDNNSLLNSDDMKILVKNGYLKPTLYKNYYIISKLISTIPPKVLSFDKAKDLAKKDLINKKKEELLITLSKESLKNFKGNNIGYITKFDVERIPLSANLAAQFLQTEFTSQKSEDFVLLPNIEPKYSVIYKVNSQHLLNEAKYMQNIKYIEDLTSNILNNSLIDDIVNSLKQKYHIVSYLK